MINSQKGVSKMSLVKWLPGKDLEVMRKDMESLFNDFFEQGSRRGHWWMKPSESDIIVPSVEMYDRKSDIVIKAELPGVKKEDINLTITKDSITIKGEVKREEEVKEDDYYRSERVYGSFSRTVALPTEIDSKKAKASCKDGVLEIILPKREESIAKETKLEIT